MPITLFSRFPGWVRAFRESLVLPWVIVFLVGGLLIPQNGCQLELPRMLTLRALVDDHSAQIGKYIDWTDEWSRTPDGRYYNNRAPGPVLLGLPLFFVVDRLIEHPREGGKLDEKGRRPWPGTLPRLGLSFFLQMLPFAILVMLGARWLLQRGASPAAVHFFALAALFGNTAAIFMNNWSGHGLTAAFALGAVLAFLHRKPFWVAFCLGNAVLCDYGASLLAPPLLAAMVWQNRRVQDWALPFLLGGIFPGVLWVWYHTVAFGGPLTIANVYQNPMYINVHDEGNIAGLFKPRPDPEIIYELLFGARRGILPTQPWLLLALPLVAWAFLRGKKRDKEASENRQLLLFAGVSLFLLFWMNASFGGWHAGNTAGPRYMSEIYPVWALLAALAHDRLPPWARSALWGALAASLVFRGLVFAVNPMSPLEPLWKYLWTEIVAKETLTNWLRLFIYFALMAGAGWWIWRKAGRLPAFAGRNFK